MTQYTQRDFTAKEKSNAKKIVAKYIRSGDKNSISDEANFEIYKEALASQFYFNFTDDSKTHNSSLGLEHPLHFGQDNTFEIHFIDKEGSAPDEIANHVLQHILPGYLSYPTEYYAEVIEEHIDVVTVKDLVKVLLQMGFEYLPDGCCFSGDMQDIEIITHIKAPDTHFITQQEQNKKALQALKKDNIKSLDDLVKSGFDINCNLNDKSFLLKAYELEAHHCIDYLFENQLDLFRVVGFEGVYSEVISYLENPKEIIRIIDIMADKKQPLSDIQTSNFFGTILSKENSSLTERVINFMGSGANPVILSYMDNLSKSNPRILMRAVKDATDDEIKEACVFHINTPYIVNWVLSQRKVDLSNEYCNKWTRDGSENILIGDYVNETIDTLKEKISRNGSNIYSRKQGETEFTSDLQTLQNKLREYDKLANKIAELVKPKAPKI